MDFQMMAVIADKAQFAEFVHEKADPRPRGSHNLGQCLLADLRDDGFRVAFFAKIRKQQEDPRQPLFAGVEQQVHQILFNLDAAG